ncbi:hypothetical protein [Corynebacterium striatum]|uniref:hypothetical protein n=1 Tax=Corynebacterium striatum TaxID=43770 RepID=UPI0019201C82|nr:hypothetical protein [Corynebacterium striatum]MCG7250213.1 hypothetical protein [Corynebacterium striatum]QQU78507.1 hypothetical protein I6I73_06715 [Corynebacterium striatum]HAT1181599.1 hypothetical protein [Corynebacterium striatum]HAT1243029.1 hypothetical protein [Corynebacterium striatum]HAT6540327.1 hypothetical protein [Corynebacterium striatum]
MTSPLYPIPHLGLGAVQSLPVWDAATAPSDPEKQLVSLTRLTNGGWDVMSGEEKLGSIAARDAAEYPEIELLFDAGLTPAVTFRHGTQPAILLPRPGLCLPANNPPSSPWAILDYAPAISVHDIPDDVDIPHYGRIHLLVTLRTTESDPHSISAYLGPQFIATLDDAPAYLSAIITENAADGLTTLAHAYHYPRQNGRVLNIYASNAVSQESREGTGQERLLAERTATTSVAAETFETASFKAITDTDLSRIDRLPSTKGDASPTPGSPKLWLILIILTVVALILSTVYMAAH